MGRSVETTGVPAACASICTRPNASLRATLGSANTSAARYQAASASSSCGGKQRHAVADASRDRDLSQPRLERPRADQHQVRVDVLHGSDQHVDTLVVDEPAHEQHDLAPAMRRPQLVGKRLGRGIACEALDAQPVVDVSALLGTRREELGVLDHVE